MAFSKNNIKEIISFLKYLYIVFVFVLLLVLILELKSLYQIDIFPGVDTPIDNLYYQTKDEYLKV
jgi:hypothetical protein